jgi:hypothetical protein
VGPIHSCCLGMEMRSGLLKMVLKISLRLIDEVKEVLSKSCCAFGTHRHGNITVEREYSRKKTIINHAGLYK